MKFHTSLFDVLNSNTKFKIVKFLLKHEAFMSEREIASVLNVSHMSVNRIAKELENMNFVNFAKIGNVHLWRVNHKSYAYKVFSEFIKRISSIKEPLEDLKDTILRNLPKDLIKKLVLFGSIVKGLEKANSDIDLFILVENRKIKDKLEPSMKKLTNLCLDKYGNLLAPYILTEYEMEQKKQLRLISEIEKGLQIFPKK